MLHVKFSTPINREHARKVGANYALLFLGCLLFHVVGTWSLPLIDRDEPRFAEASREMRDAPPRHTSYAAEADPEISRST